MLCKNKGQVNAFDHVGVDEDVYPPFISYYLLIQIHVFNIFEFPIMLSLLIKILIK